MKTISKIFLAAALCATASAQATVINSMAGGTSMAFSPLNLNTNDPVSENGFTWKPTNGGLYGWTQGYVLGSNGSWSGPTPIIASGLGQVMTITFDSPVSSVLAFVNHGPTYGTPYMAIYDVNNVLLEQHFLNISTPNGFNAGEDWGFSQSSATIKSFVLGDGYIVAANLRTLADPTPVPEPETYGLLGVGTVALALARRRKARGAVPEFAATA